MFSRKFMKTWLILLAIVAVVLLIGSCSKTKPEGPEVKNFSPKVEIVNIPPNNSHFTTNPQIYWFGTDVDGKIVTYEYAVVPRSLLVASHVDTTSDSAIVWYARDNIKKPEAGKDCKPESCWQIVDVAQADNPNRQTIRLFADKDPAISIAQYFFVRAVDNDSARSGIDYRLYSRANHPPDTEIKTVPSAGGYYDLPDTSLIYKGIFIEWKGTDKIDYPDDNQEPVFEYFYQVFGPYQRNEIYRTVDSATDAFDYTRIDTTDTNKLVMTSRDTLTGGVWVSKNNTHIYGVWKGHSDTTRSGYFVLKVTSRDDAFVSDTLPAYVPFFTIDAKFENDLLVYVPAFCAPSAQQGEISCDGYMPDTVIAFYHRVIAAAGYGSAKVVTSTAGAGPESVVRFSKLELAHYKVYMMIDDGNISHLIDSNYMDVTPYLELGGNVWVWALSPFGCYYNAVGAQMNSLVQKRIPYLYFDVTGEYYGGWGESYRIAVTDWMSTRCKHDAHPIDTCVPLPTNEEFLGGLALGTVMPSFDVDLAKCSKSYITFPILPINWRGTPNTNYFQRNAFSEPLWLFKSYFGDFVPDSMKHYVTGLQGRVIGLRYDPYLFRTAVYGFSMYMLPEAQAIDIFHRTMDWFLRPR